MFAVFYVLVWVSVKFFNKLDPVPRLVRERNNNMAEQYFTFGNEERLDRNHKSREHSKDIRHRARFIIMLNYSGIKGTVTRLLDMR